MQDSKHNYTLTFDSPGRDVDEEWETIEPQLTSYWQEAADVFRHRTFEHKNCQIQVSIDWSPFVRRSVKDSEIMRLVRLEKTENYDWYKEISQPIELNVECIISGSNELSKHTWYPLFFLEYFLYEVFVTSNLACPGSAEFFRLSIQGATQYDDRLRLSAFYFDDWLVETIRGVKPAAQLINPRKVTKWLASVIPQITQRAKNGTQQAIFSLYHLCRNDGHIDFVMWLFSALESLLSTRVGENFSGMVRRVALVLGLEPPEAAFMQKRLRKLYELRSSFVHGGYATPHPMHTESIDERLGDDYGKILELSKYGFFVLASLLQKMIEMNRTSLTFGEILTESEDTFSPQEDIE